MTRYGHVAIVGRPNVGKSTLLNHLLGRKLSITSRKPQTTRDAVLGVLTEGDLQIAFVDTPGIHAVRPRAINRFMVSEALGALRDVDLAVVVIEAAGLTDDDRAVLRRASTTGVRTLCAINKIDRLKQQQRLLPLIDEARAFDAVEEFVPISALRNRGLDDLLREISRRMPEGPHLFPAEQVTDRPTEFLVAEIVREKLMRRLGDELPHRAAVVVEQLWRPEGAKATHIDAVIHVERESQKGIVIGRGGARMKSIGEDARRDIEFLLGGDVMLRLWVKVAPGWTNSGEALRRFGYR